MKRAISILITILTVISVMSCAAFTSSAANTTAFGKITSSAYAKTYTLSTSGKLTTVYTSSTLKTRGTVTYGASSSSYIDCASDELYIYKIAKNSSGTYYAYLSYPTSSSRAYAYVPLSKITPNSASSSSKKSTGKFYCAPRNGGILSSSYYVDKGDTVYLLASTASTAQILYPISSGKWRIAFCKLSDYNKYCNSTTTSSTSSTASYTGYVNTSSSPLVLRKSASTSAAAITNMPKGSSLTVLDNKAKTNGFYHVKYNGTTGYASASYITFTKPTSTVTKSGKISFSYTNSGTGYSTSSSVNLKVNGTSVTNGSTFYTYTSNGTNYTTKAPSGYTYAKVNRRMINMNGYQCCAFARYIQYLLYGCQDFSSSGRFKWIAKNQTATASSIKSWVTQAGVGAHIRSKYPHSLIVIAIDSTGFYYTDANATGNANQIRVGHYTWQGFANSNFRNISEISYYVG